MDRADKIFTIMAALALVAVLLWQRRTTPRVNVSALPSPVSDTGPAYLLSNLPAHRTSDDSSPAVSYPEAFAF
jgi:hypothetical protein